LDARHIKFIYRVLDFTVFSLVVLPVGWSQKTLVEKISGPWHPKQGAGWRHTNCKAVEMFH
jgi:hypothetical protein